MRRATLAGLALLLPAAPALAQEMRMEIGPVAYRDNLAGVGVRITNMTGVGYRNLRFVCEFRGADAVLATAEFTLPALAAGASETRTVEAPTGDAPIYQVDCRGLF